MSDYVRDYAQSIVNVLKLARSEIELFGRQSEQRANIIESIDLMIETLEREIDAE